jgi:capsular exopolysaccharide synthesis family protein
MEQKENLQTEEWHLLKFDPIVLVRDVAKHWLLILLVVRMVGMGAYIYGSASYKPEYRTTFTYVTYTRNSATTVYNNLTSANMVAGVFEELLNSSLFRNTVLRESGLSAFQGTVSASVIPETNILTVTVSGSDPRSVFLMAQAIVDHHESVTYQVIDNVSLELLRSPTVPTGPSNTPNAKSLAKKAVILATAGIVAVLAYLSIRKDTVRSGREARSKLDCSYLGDVPHERRFRTLMSRLRWDPTNILVTNPLTSFRFVETFRKLASRVEYHMHGKKVVMVTSLLESEGKSTVSVNMALSMALKHERVLLIDCDLRKPACHGLLEMDAGEHGLRAVLEGTKKPGEAVLQDKKSGLYVLLETNGTQASEDYLGSRQMADLLRWARERFDMVVLDLPPMALVSDAEGMMELADASVLVVRQNKAKAGGINRAIATLEGGNAKLLGCVLNDVYATGLSGGGYGYGYGYGYGRYGRYGKYGYYGKYGHYGHYGRYDRYSPKEDQE